MILRHSSLLLLLLSNTTAFAPPGGGGTTFTTSHIPSHKSSTRDMVAASAAADMDMSNRIETTSTDDNNSDTATKVGVLLLNLGGPETGDDVEGFLYNLFADPDIIRLPAPLSPLQSILAYGISKSRSPKSRAAYESIGGGSPILKYSNAQARLIEETLHRKYDLKAKCYVGMRYWHPFTEDALEEIVKDEINALVIVPLYPQFSISTSGSSLRVLQEEFVSKRVNINLNTRSLRAGSIGRATSPAWPNSSIGNLNVLQEDKHVLFSAHGVPKSYIDAGDPYQEQIQKCVDAIGEQLPLENDRIHLSYQSRVGPIEWLRPYTDDVLPDLGQKGIKNLVVVPISFVSEHIETLEEIDIEYRELAEENGISNWRRCPALNTDEGFIEDMADLVMDALSEPATTVTEACVANNCEIETQPFDERMGMVTSLETNTAINREDKSNDEKDDVKSMITAELLNGRLAMMGVAGTMLLELLNGKSLLRLFGMM
eukprot:CAMPEP_0116015328 /NCGR_PEP_ID=MMETSP0321-20121206/6780_1 /TAXON_ID=163516 /ORGANISM="Leptocylindrus danicus var. danicus, Strain B650" /LENGTH=485 /DNA_ID=CAMNT_0003485095 /DNA_START=27 /DNA_END=1485 /DNA_ORIENTATION=+